MPFLITGRARVALLAAALGACGGDHATAPARQRSLPSQALAIARQVAATRLSPLTKLSLPTPDGTGDLVHPSVVYFANGWHGWKYWMAYTPYFGSNSRIEDPCIAVSNDGITWTTPAGEVNPLDHAPYGRYNSDPDLSYDTARDALVLHYRQVSTDQNIILVIASRNGVDWTSAKFAFTELNHEAVSPSWVTPSSGAPTMVWYVNATRDGCGTAVSFVKLRTATADTLGADGTSWSPPNEDLHWAQRDAVIWHLKVREVASKGQFWALYPAYPTGQRGCGSDDLYFARSNDGAAWQSFPVPILRHDDLGLAMLYRADFVYDPATDRLNAWISAMDTQGRWGVYFTSFDYSALLSVLTRAKRMDPLRLVPNDVRRPPQRLVLIAP